jgi:hypothetical protein
MAHRGGSKCPKVAGGLTVLLSHAWLAARHVNSGKFVWPREAATTAKPGNGRTQRAYLWAYCAFENTKSVVYDLCESRASEHARTFLGKSKGGLALRRPHTPSIRDAVQLTCTVPGATIRLAHGTPDDVGGYWFIYCKRPVIPSLRTPYRRSLCIAAFTALRSKPAGSKSPPFHSHIARCSGCIGSIACKKSL